MLCTDCDGEGYVEFTGKDDPILCSRCGGSGEEPDGDGKWEWIEDWDDEFEEDEDETEEG